MKKFLLLVFGCQLFFSGLAYAGSDKAPPACQKSWREDPSCEMHQWAFYFNKQGLRFRKSACGRESAIASTIQERKNLNDSKKRTRIEALEGFGPLDISFGLDMLDRIYNEPKMSIFERSRHVYDECEKQKT